MFDSSTDCQVLREGMGQSTGATASSALDVVITNALIIDAVLGVVKADIGIRGDTIVGIGKAGNPDVMDGVSEDMVVGATTEAIAGEKLILTAGTIDTHVHWICPQVRRPLASLGKSPPPIDSMDLLADCNGGDRVGCDDNVRRRHRPSDRYERDHVHARAVASQNDDASDR